MARSSFMADERDLHFALFEHQKFDELLKLPHFSELSVDTAKEMISTTLSLITDVFGPLNVVGDREGCHFNKETLEVTTPSGFKEAYKVYCENGYMAFTVSPERGGLGMPVALGVVIAELFSGCNPAFMMYGGLSRAGANLLDAFGDDWMRSICVAKIVEGTWSGTMCLTEPAVGSAVGDLQAKAIPQPDGTYLIDGVKQWISAGEQDFTENIIHLVLARIEGAPVGMKGVSLFMVPKIRFNIETGELGEPNDVKCIGIEEKMGIHGNSTCLMRLGDEGRCQGYLIGQPNNGIAYMFQMMNEARIGVGVQGLALASTSFLNAQEYSKTRIQGTDVAAFKNPNAPRVPIIQHPDVRRMLMRQRAIVEGARALIYTAAFSADMAEHHTDADVRELNHGYLELLTPVVKAWCTDMGFDVTINAVQTYGGYGYTRDYPVEQNMRDLKISSIYEGTNGIQALDLLGRKMRMKGGAIYMQWVQRMNDFISANEEHFFLSEEIRLLSDSKNMLTDTAMHLAQLGMTGSQHEAVLNATPFLMLFGHVSVAYLLLEQATIAAEKMMSAEGNDQVFYRNKIRTARFFVHNILPEARAWSIVVKGSDKTALEFEFGEV